MSVSGSSSGTELLWTRSMDIFWSLTRAEGRKEAVDCVENNWFDAQHTLAHCSAPECLCRIVSRLCIVRFSNWQLHIVGWETWLGYAQLTMGNTDTTGSMHTLALPLLSAGCHTVSRLCIEQFNKQCASNRGLINTVHWTRLFNVQPLSACHIVSRLFIAHSGFHRYMHTLLLANLRICLDFQRNNKACPS